MILGFLEWIVLLLDSVERVELLDSSGLVLVSLVFVGKKADGTKLASYDEGMAVFRELAVKWVVHHVLVN